MSPLRSPLTLDRIRVLGVEAVFAGQVDSQTARSEDILLWDDDAVILRLESRRQDLDRMARPAA